MRKRTAIGAAAGFFAVGVWGLTALLATGQSATQAPARSGSRAPARTAEAKPIVGVQLAANPVVPAASSSSAPAHSSTDLLVRLDHSLSAEAQRALLAASGGHEVSAVSALGLHVLRFDAASLDTALARLRTTTGVLSADVDRTRAVRGTPSDIAYPQQWNLPKIGWDTVQGVVHPAGTATIAVLDTGVDGANADLAGALVPGWSAFDGGDPNTDPNGHGTWLAGIAAAAVDNADGIAGVGYEGVKVAPVQVLGADGLGADSDVIAGVVWAADNGAKVILMGFSNPGYSSDLQLAIDYAWSKGAVVVAATGNEGSTTPTYPAGDAKVVGVSATNTDDTLWSLSNSGVDTFLAAPGVDIPVDSAGGGTAAISGTSASSAMVAGAAAVLAANDPAASNGTIVGRLARNADPAGTADETGNGRLNLARALADTATDDVVPVGSPPVGDGGPFVGPYVVAVKPPDGMTLDKTRYQRTDTAHFDLVASALNTSSSTVESATVHVSSESDTTGFDITVDETGKNTGEFVGTFGFTSGPSSATDKLIKAGPGKQVTVSGGGYSATAVMYIDNATVSLDKTHYHVGDTAALTVNDIDRNLNPGAIETVTATLSSTSDTSGRTITLTETGANTGIFTGSATFTTGASSGTTLKIAAGNSITMLYQQPVYAGGGSIGVYAFSVAYTDSASVGFDKTAYRLSDSAVLIVNDADRNQHAGVAETLTATVSSTSDPTGLTVTFTETGINSNQFNATITFTSDASAGSALKLAAGDAINLSYAEPLLAGGTTPRTNLRYAYTDTATIAFDRANYAVTDTPIVTIIDTDRNATTNSADTVTFTIGSSSFTATETSVNSGVFRRTLTLSTGAGANLQVAPGGNLTATYAEPLFAGSTADRTASASMDTDGATIAWDKAHYAQADTAAVTVTDVDADSSGAADTVNFTINGTSFTATEDGAHTGVFTRSVAMSGGGLAVAAGDTLSASYNEPSFNGGVVTRNATASALSDTATASLDSDQYTPASAPVLSVDDVDADTTAGLDAVTATFSSDTDSTGISLTLTETAAHSHVFTRTAGFTTSGSSDASTATLRITAGDTVTLSYAEPLFAGGTALHTDTASTSQPTDTAASDATATYGDAAVTLSASVTSSFSTVSSGSVAFTVKDGSTVIGSTTSGAVSGGSASVSYSLPAGTAAKAYTIVAAFSDPTGAYLDSSDSSHSLTVQPKPVTVTANDQHITYGDPEPSFTHTDDGLVGSDSLSGVSCDAADPHTAVGSYTISCSVTPGANPDYSVSTAPGTLKIDPAALTATVTGTQVYGGTASFLVAGIDGFVNGEDSSVVTGPLSGCTTDAVATSPVAGTYSVSNCGGLSAPNYTISYADGGFTVTRALVTATVTGTQVYGGTGTSFAVGHYSDFANGEDSSVVTGPLSGCTTDAVATSPVAGAYSVSNCAGLSAANYAISYADGGFTVTRAPLTATVTGTQAYGGTGTSFVVDHYSDFVNGEDSSVVTGPLSGCTTDAVATSPVAGAYSVSNCGGLSAANYAIGYADGGFTVTRAPLTATVTGTQVYGGTGTSFAVDHYSDFVNGEDSSVVTGPLSGCTTDATASSPVLGTYHVSDCAGLSAANYAIGYADGGFTVTRAPLTATVTGTQVYGGTASFAVDHYSDFANGEDDSVVTGPLSGCTTDATASSPVLGTYHVSDCAGLSAANYAISYADGGFTVTPAPLTATVKGTQVYGGTGTSFTVDHYSDFANGENSSVVTGPLSGCTTDATASSPVLGTYHVSNCAGLSAANYAISYADGGFTVTPASLTVKADDVTVVWGSSAPTLTASYATFVLGQDESVLGGTLSLATLGTPTSTVGTYAITPSGLTSSNYAITFSDGAYKVVKADVSGGAADNSATVGASSVALSASVSPVAPSTEGVNEGTVTFKILDAAATVKATVSAPVSGGAASFAYNPSSLTVGAYTIAASYGGATNHNNAALAAGTLFVTPAGVSVTASNSSGTTASIPCLSAAASGGTGTVTVAGYSANPEGVTPFTAGGSFFDVHLSAGNTFTSVTVTRCNLPTGVTTAWWYDAAAATWRPVSPQSFDGGTGTLTMTLSGSSSPALSKLTGTAFGTSPTPTTVIVAATPDVQYSDRPTLSATVTATPVPGQPLSGTVAFSVDGTAMGSAAIDALGVATISAATSPPSAQLLKAPGTYAVKAVFTPDTPYYDTSSGTGSVKVVQEDATVVYTGPLQVFASSTSASAATVQLAATIQDITATDAVHDPDAGNISNAKVSFVKMDTNPPTVLCSNLTVALAVSSDPKTGTASCTWQAPIPSNPGYADYTIGVQVSGYYVRPAAVDAQVNVALPFNSGFITGGGYIVVSASAGTQAATTGTNNNFGFNVKYNKSNTNLQGNINTIVRSGGRVYQVKGNSMTSLITKVGSTSSTATFNGKASIQDVTDPLNPISVDGGATLQVNMTDYGEPGSKDTIGITVWLKTGAMWFSSTWNSTKTIEKTLSGGNLSVK